MIASSMPQPTAAPFTAAITGTSVVSSASAAGVIRGVVANPLATRSPADRMICFTSSPEQNAGSAPVITRHRAVVERTIGGISALYVEVLEREFRDTDGIADAFFLDSGLSATFGSPTTAIGGLWHLEGQSVYALADGLVQGPFTVASGGITLTTAASTVHVGLQYSSLLETLRLEAGGADGVAQGKALYAGISSYSSARTVEAARLLADRGVPLLIHQPSYSMFNRWLEGDGLLDTLESVGAGCIAFSPLRCSPHRFWSSVVSPPPRTSSGTAMATTR